MSASKRKILASSQDRTDWSSSHQSLQAYLGTDPLKALTMQEVHRCRYPCLLSSLRTHDVRLAQTLFIFSLSFKMTSVVVFPTLIRSDSSRMLTRRSSSIISHTESTKPALISPGRPDLESSSVEFLPSEKKSVPLVHKQAQTEGFRSLQTAFS